MSRIEENRSQPDVMFLIVKRPAGWRPRNYFDKPVSAKIVSKTPVASYDEAHDDMQRCNRLSLHHSLDTWAIVQVDGDKG